MNPFDFFSFLLCFSLMNDSAINILDMSSDVQEQNYLYSKNTEVKLLGNMAGASLPLLGCQTVW